VGQAVGHETRSPSSIWRREINPGKVFDLELPLAEAAEGYRAMDERRAIKVLLRP
jgi:threonine dehydrogenase-like Zn-dependent dehydrogenase